MRNIIVGLLSLSFAIILSLPSCTYRKTQEILGSVCDTSNTKYSTFVSTMINTNCNSETGCHGASAGSISLEAYTDVSGLASDILSRIKSGNMPKGHSKLDDCTIERFEAWVNKGARNN